MPEVVCLGELLIDFCAEDEDAPLSEARTFVKAPGGAPANVAVGLARLGLSTGLIAAVGNDPFGDYLRGLVAREGVDVLHLVQVEEARTSLAFIASRSDGRKDISFYRNPGADMMLAPKHIDPDYLHDAEAFHYGSISLIDPSPAEATFEAHLAAQESGCLISYDPNWRPTLWPDHDLARERLLAGFGGTHVAKVSEEEWEFITGYENFNAGAHVLLDRGPELVVRSEGEAGASFATTEVFGHVRPFRVECVESTGAGDGFVACLIAELLGHWKQGTRPGELDQQELMRICRRANAAGALACTRVGAIPSLPTASQVDEFLQAGDSPV